jgi:hypothetical protein
MMYPSNTGYALPAGSKADQGRDFLQWIQSIGNQTLSQSIKQNFKPEGIET